MPIKKHHKTDLSLGFFIVPVDIVSDTDFKSLDDSEVSLLFKLYALCCANPDSQTQGDRTLPPYSWSSTDKRMRKRLGKTIDFVYNTLIKFRGFGWLDFEAENDKSEICITLTRAHKWQSFDTYKEARRRKRAVVRELAQNPQLSYEERRALTEKRREKGDQ